MQIKSNQRPAETFTNDDSISRLPVLLTNKKLEVFWQAFLIQYAIRLEY
jgi:hypothetical protein